MSNMVVRTNVLALNSHRNLGMVGTQQSKASSRLSSGFRINSAADDAAGLGISEKMRSQIRGLNQASRNAQDGISLIQTAEGAMSTINDMIARIRELVVQAANDTNVHDGSTAATWSQSDRTKIQGEIDQLLLEIDATVGRTEFNTRRLLDGSIGGTGDTGGTWGPLAPGATLSAFPNANFTGNTFVPGALGTGFDYASVQKTAAEDAEILKAFEAALTTLITGYEGASQDAAVTTWLQGFDGGGSDDITATGSGEAGITNLQLLFNYEADAAKPHNALVVAARDALMKALNDVDLSKLVQKQAESGELSSVSGRAETWADLGQIFDGNITRDNLGPSDGFKFAEGESATTLQTAINVALGTLLTWDLTPSALNTDVSAWLAIAEADDSTPVDLTGTTPAFTTLQALMAFDRTATTLTANDLEAASNAQDALRAAINGALTGIFEADDNNNGGGNEGGESGPGLWFQVGANRDQGVNLTIKDVGVNALSFVGDQNVTEDPGAGSAYTFKNLFSGSDRQSGFFVTDTKSTIQREILDVNAVNLDFSENREPVGVMRASGEEIQKFITAIDFALSHATKERSNLGAMQNRLEFTIQNLDIASENLSAAESRIRDADMALEMMRLTQANVLQQAATAMLAQANQAPQSILQLLG